MEVWCYILLLFLEGKKKKNKQKQTVTPSMTGRTQAAQILIFSQIVLYKSCPLKSSRESYVAVMLANDPVKESPLVVCPTLLN